MTKSKDYEYTTISINKKQRMELEEIKLLIMDKEKVELAGPKEIVLELLKFYKKINKADLDKLNNSIEYNITKSNRKKEIIKERKKNEQ